MTLNELKVPFEQIIKAKKIKLSECNATKIAEQYTSCSKSDEDLLMAILVCKAWPSLQYIYYKKNITQLSAEECYDIFLETLEYVLGQQAWKDESSSLYGDKLAFEKAVTVTIQCRKKNYLHAQHRQKRLANYNSVSLEGISEDCSEGYFIPDEPQYSFEEQSVNKIIKDYFMKKDYITAFVLESILNFNVYTISNELDIRKLRKYLRNLDFSFCDVFAEKYSVNKAEVQHSLSYFKNVPQIKLDSYIKNTFTKLKDNAIIKQIVY